MTLPKNGHTIPPVDWNYTGQDDNVKDWLRQLRKLHAPGRVVAESGLPPRTFFYIWQRAIPDYVPTDIYMRCILDRVKELGGDHKAKKAVAVEAGIQVRVINAYGRWERGAKW